MNIKSILITLLFLFISVSGFAQNKTVVFFAENFDGISAQVIQKIESSDKFCLAVVFDENKYIKKEIQNLIFSYKIEPLLNILEPYFPLISSEIKINSSAIFDKTETCKNILNDYKKNYRTTFERYKHGLYLKGAALTNETLDIFYKSNILWTITDCEEEIKKGLFVKNNVVLFVPYRDFPSNETKIKQWFLDLSSEKIIPIILKSTHIKNEKLMLTLINFINKNNEIDVALPINAAFYEYQHNKAIKQNIFVNNVKNIPIENIVKLYIADKEISEYAEKANNEDIITILYDELSNMYSYNVINGILNKDKNSSKIFDISYTNIFRLLNKKVPNINEFKEFITIKDKLNNSEQDTICEFVAKDNKITINNDASSFFTMFSVSANDKFINFITDAVLTNVDSIDIYIDMNGIAYTGSQKMLKPINSFFVPENSWEFAVRITKEKIYIYKHLADNAELIETIQNEKENSNIKISSNILRGNPYNWSYQVVAVKDNKVVDFIEEKENKENIFKKSPLQLDMFKYKK